MGDIRKDGMIIEGQVLNVRRAASAWLRKRSRCESIAIPIADSVARLIFYLRDFFSVPTVKCLNHADLRSNFHFIFNNNIVRRCYMITFFFFLHKNVLLIYIKKLQMHIYISIKIYYIVVQFCRQT